MRHIGVFVDESGSVKKGELTGKDYFVIAMIFTDNEKFLKKVFTKQRLKVLTKDEIRLLAQSKEIKGSAIDEQRKQQIYQAVAQKCCNHVEVGLIVLDLKESDERLRNVSSRAFNFLIARYLSAFYKKYSKFSGYECVDLYVDERNVKTGAKYTLEEYLNTEYNIEDPICQGDITVHYLDSKNRNLIQFADFLANTAYRAYKKNHQDARDNISVLNDILCHNRVFYFPIRHRLDSHQVSP